MYFLNSLSTRLRTVLSLFLALALALTLLPLELTQDAFADTADQPLSDEAITEMLASGNYAEGEAIVIIDESRATASLRLLGDDLLSSAEPLMKTTEEIYNTAVNDSDAVLAAPEDFASIGRSLSTEDEETISILHITNSGMATEDLLYLLRDDPRVLHVEPNYVYEISPQDTNTFTTQNTLPAAETLDLTDYQWANSNDDTTMFAQTKALGFDINPPEWENRLNNPAANACGTVAVLDSGVDYTHPDLAGIIRNDMKDFVPYGGTHGFNVDTSSGNIEPMDTLSHGTHCAGIIASEWNEFGTGGVASGVKMVAVRISDDQDMLYLSYILNGYEYLADAMEADLDLKAINNSWGSAEASRAFSIAVAKLGDLGAISVVASGNDSSDTDYTVYSSGALQSNPYAVIINSSNMHGALSCFSNYGIATTNIVAPGSQILSTYPVAQSTYLPEAVSPSSSRKNIVYESFTDSSISNHAFKAYGGSNLDMTIGEQSSEAYFDSDKKSLKLEVKDMTDGLVDGSYASKIFASTITVPQSEQNLFRYLGFHFFAPQDLARASLIVSVKVKDAADDFAWRSTTIRSWSNEWRNASIDIQELLQDGDTLFYEGADSEELGLTFEYYYTNISGPFPDIEAFYLDAIGIGQNGATVPYRYIEGTSMATPAATGAAMVLATFDNPSLSAADQAKERAARLTGAVCPVPAFEDLCSSGGALDLAQATANTYTPVPSTVELLTEADEVQINIKGWFFGQNPGSVVVGGTDSNILSWSDNLITVVCPSTVSNGVHNIAITSAQGRTGNKSFLLELPESPENNATPLYEYEYELPAEIVETGSLLQFKMIGLGGYLYLFPGEYLDEGLYEKVWKLDSSSGAWTQCASLPKMIDFLSLISYDGKIIATGFNIVGDEGFQLIYSYDPLSDTWEELPGQKLPFCTTLVNCKDRVLTIGGATNYSEWYLSGVSSAINEYSPETGEITLCGNLTAAGYGFVANARENDIIVAYGSRNSSAVFANHIAMPSCTVTDLSSLLPSFGEGRDNCIDVASLSEGFAFVGSSATGGTGDLEDQDTYIAEISGQNQDQARGAFGATFTPFNKRVSYSQLFDVSATSHRGMLYSLGVSYYEENGYALRATAVETREQPGDLYMISYHDVEAQEHNNPTGFSASQLPLSLSPANDRSDATFGGWYSNAEFSGEAITSLAQGTLGDIELWAKWIPVSPDPGPVPGPKPVDVDSGAIAKTRDASSAYIILCAGFVLLGLGVMLFARRRVR